MLTTNSDGRDVRSDEDDGAIPKWLNTTRRTTRSTNFRSTTVDSETACIIADYSFAKCYRLSSGNRFIPIVVRCALSLATILGCWIVQWRSFDELDTFGCQALPPKRLELTVADDDVGVGEPAQPSQTPPAELRTVG